MKARFDIDVYSDVVCPWCYVGKRRLERALAQLPDQPTVEVTWRPFQLNPTMPVEGMRRTAYLQGKFGSLEAFGRMEEQVRDAGAAEGIAFAFERIERTPNTFQAHRLIWYARQAGRQDAVVDSLFKGYFEEGKAIDDLSSLMPLAERAGLEVTQFLSTADGTAEVKAEEAAGHRLGIRGVPYFVIDDTYALSGAQPPDRFVAALKAAQADRAVRKVGG